MKRLLLFGVFAFFSQLQAQYIMGFEASESYRSGESIVGQNSWLGTSGTDAVITNELAKAGTQSLKIRGNGTYNITKSGISYPLSTTISNSTIRVSFDFNLEPETDADFYLAPVSSNDFYAAYFVIAAEEMKLYVYQSDPEDATSIKGTVVDNVDLKSNEWHTIKLEIKKDQGVINYYYDEKLVFVGNTLAGTDLSKLYILNDNGYGSVNLDNLTLRGDDTLGVNDFKDELFSVYPNPVSDILKINSKNQIEKVQVYDLSGKEIPISYVNGQINVSSLEKGMYIIKAKNNNGHLSVVKFLKK